MENPSHNTSGKYMKGAREEIENVKESEQEGGEEGKEEEQEISQPVEFFVS